MPVVTTKICNVCGGDGEYEGGTCPNCGGTGELPLGTCTHAHTEANVKHIVEIVDAIRLPTNVFYSHVIWEATDLTEFTALSDANKDAYRGIVRMGTVSLVDGSHSRNSLWDMFDSESTTRASLLALLD